uniref:Uncharacterized protein n=1 Tax=Spironucleus salmonicida TaxID=348837 RepID=V6LNM6_9EUKA|eukprot:EST42339.1 Hypothetical protein SS50377_18128 [Spironucleus salmonicida]
MARRKCKPPIGSVPQDCPWVQLVVNGEVLNVANSNLESAVHFQLAVAVERNTGKTAAVDMPVASATYLTGEALVEELEGDADCYSVISLSAFQDHVNVTFAANAGAVNCQQHVYDRALLQIQGVTTQFYKLVSEVPSLPEWNGSVILNTANAENATEFGGNLTIAMDGRRSAQYLYIQYTREDTTLLEEDSKISDTGDVPQPNPNFVRPFHFHSGPADPLGGPKPDHLCDNDRGVPYQFVWEQRPSDVGGQYCYEITNVKSNELAARETGGAVCDH